MLEQQRKFREMTSVAFIAKMLEQQKMKKWRSGGAIGKMLRTTRSSRKSRQVALIAKNDGTQKKIEEWRRAVHR